MRVSTRVGRRTTVSMNLRGWLVLALIVCGLIGMLLGALGLH